MRRKILNGTIGFIGLMLVLSGCGRKSIEIPDENLTKYGTEYEDSENPAYDIAMDFYNVAANVISEYNDSLELYADPILATIEISQFGEEVEYCALCCQSEKGEMFWLRVAWNSSLGELCNIHISCDHGGLYSEALMYGFFHNTNISGLDNIYDGFNSTTAVEVNDYDMRWQENILAEGWAENWCNIDFLAHTINLENNSLCFSNGEEINIDYDWAFNVLPG